MQRRYISLDATERTTLEAGRHHHPQHQFRARCQGWLWSADGHSVPALAALLGVGQGTVYGWFNRWERGGLAGLANAKGQGGQGRPAILQPADRERVKAAVLRQELGKDFSALTLKRFLKRVGANGGASARA